MSGKIMYSTKVPGDAGNYNAHSQFDLNNGYVGITQWFDGDIERVLLSRDQVAALIAFSAIKPAATAPLLNTKRRKPWYSRLLLALKSRTLTAEEVRQIIGGKSTGDAMWRARQAGINLVQVGTSPGARANYKRKVYGLGDS
jgi:hypothetical protein